MLSVPALSLWFCVLCLFSHHHHHGKAQAAFSKSNSAASTFNLLWQVERVSNPCSYSVSLRLLSSTHLPEKSQRPISKWKSTCFQGPCFHSDLRILLFPEQFSSLLARYTVGLQLVHISGETTEHPIRILGDHYLLLNYLLFFSCMSFCNKRHSLMTKKAFNYLIKIHTL